ncbi:MAG: hypothetical protein Q9181_007782, partial [Wetmoreana brouardii]
VSAEPRCSEGPNGAYGSPHYEDCYSLLFGDFDLSGIAAIDARSHAFVVPGAQQEQESNEEWTHRVTLAKLWGNCCGPPGRLGVELIDCLTWE